MATRATPTSTECALVGLWLASDDHGMSSRTLAGHMLGATLPPHAVSHPHDPADLGRCLRLLDKIPTWAARVPELATLSPEWAALVARWDEMAETMDQEVGIDWSKGTKAARTYALMKQILAGARTRHTTRPTFDSPQEAAAFMADTLGHAARHTPQDTPPAQDT